MGRFIFLGLMAASLAALLLRGHAVAASFDCSRATLVSERTICANPQLSAKDDELDSVYRDVRLRLEMRKGDVAALAGEEQRWLKLRSACQDNVKCLGLWYDQRIISLRLAINTLGAPDPREEGRKAGPPPDMGSGTGKGGGAGNGGGGGRGGGIVARIEKNPDAVDRADPPRPSPNISPSVNPSVSPPPRPNPSPNRQPPSSSHDVTTGTAYAITPDGRFITNVHVVKECSNITVLLNGEHSTARVLARDTEDDVALLATDLRPKAVAALRSNIRLGEGVAVFGFPLNGILATSGNFTLGNITATSGLQDDTRMLQISAPVQPGNSGGPLVDESGNVVGTVVSKLNAMKLATITDDMAQNVNFAIKSAIVAKFLDQQGVRYQKADAVGTALQPADLAERARAIAAYIECQ